MTHINDDGHLSSHLLRPANPMSAAPLLITLHGGTYTSEYFTVPGGPGGSFNETALRNGFTVLAFDRPGYAQSAPLPEADNTFSRQAEIIDRAISDHLATHPAHAVVLVGHSIGGMVALEVAARQPSWPLVGVCATGMGAVIPAGGAAEQLGSLPLSGVVDLPVADREQVMFGPPGSFTEQAQQAARGSYAPTPFVELALAPRWAKERLVVVGSGVQVPVQNFVAEHDALWDSSAQARAAFVSAFDAPVTSDLVAGAGHCIDHHLAATGVHLRQLGFALGCAAPAAGGQGRG